MSTPPFPHPLLPFYLVTFLSTSLLPASFPLAYVLCYHSSPAPLPSFFPASPPPSFLQQSSYEWWKSSDLLFPRYRTKCKRLEREAEQGFSAHPQEPLVCDTSYNTSLCVLFVTRFVTTRSNSFESSPRISVERDEGNQRTACESGQASFQTPRGRRAATGGSRGLGLLIASCCKIMRYSSEVDVKIP